MWTKDLEEIVAYYQDGSVFTHDYDARGNHVYRLYCWLLPDGARIPAFAPRTFTTVRAA